MMDRARKLLSEAYGYSAFRGQQHDVIEAALAGRDCLVLMPTGGGKSLCYQLPSMLRDGTGIVISPLIALMRDQVAALTQIGIRAAYLNSSLSWSEQAQVLDDIGIRRAGCVVHRAGTSAAGTHPGPADSRFRFR